MSDGRQLRLRLSFVVKVRVCGPRERVSDDVLMSALCQLLLLCSLPRDSSPKTEEFQARRERGERQRDAARETRPQLSRAGRKPLPPAHKHGRWQPIISPLTGLPPHSDKNCVYRHLILAQPLHANITQIQTIKLHVTFNSRLWKFPQPEAVRRWSLGHVRVVRAPVSDH